MFYLIYPDKEYLSRWRKSMTRKTKQASKKGHLGWPFFDGGLTRWLTRV
jgi:hypothetical protein